MAINRRIAKARDAVEIPRRDESSDALDRMLKDINS
jgi:hypothetical protein